VVEHEVAGRCTNEIALESPKWQGSAATDIEVDIGQLAISMWVDDPNDTWQIDHDDVSSHIMPNDADGGKAMKDRAIKAMNNAPTYQGSGNEAMNDAPIDKQQDDSRQDSCTIASKDKPSIAGVGRFKGMDEHSVVDGLSVNEMHYDTVLLNIAPLHLKGIPWHMALLNIIQCSSTLPLRI
jgi:hypothetical protein